MGWSCQCESSGLADRDRSGSIYVLILVRKVKVMSNDIEILYITQDQCRTCKLWLRRIGYIQNRQF